MIEEILKSEPLATELYLHQLLSIWEIDPKKGFDINGQVTLSTDKIADKAYQRRDAKGKTDFQIIFETEFNKTKLEATSDNKLYYASNLIESLNKVLNKYKNGVPHSKDQVHLITKPVYDFVSWLETEKISLAKNKNHIKKENGRNITSVKDLFKNENQYHQAIEVLIESKAIDKYKNVLLTTRKWPGEVKSWLITLEYYYEQTKIQASGVNWEKVTELVNKEFVGAEISLSTNGKTLRPNFKSISPVEVLKVSRVQKMTRLFTKIANNSTGNK